MTKRKYTAQQQEQFSEAFLQALAAVNGCTTAFFRPDINGFDCLMTLDVPRSALGMGSLNIQLKSTTQPKLFKGGFCNYSLKAKYYNKLIKKSASPSILVVVFLPEKIEEWLNISTEDFLLKHAAYWVSFEGKKVSKNKSSVSIDIPSTNHLTTESLNKILLYAADKKTPTGVAC